ncbi:MAG: hypothetical protein MJ107_01755 [Lachnospiraceae bacterium]|nr:hypothetical protein [Lachnospiraceae bacterium]
MKNNKERLIGAALMAFLPILLCVLRALANGEGLFDVWFCGSNWQDELFYYQLTSGVVSHGIPQGYFGYNEGAAPYLTFGTWSPLLLIFWSLFGVIFGWNVLAPVLCNILLMSIALFIFVWLVRPGKLQLAVMALLISALTPFSRFMMSCMPEIPALFTVIIMLACWYPCLNTYKKTYMTTAYIFFFIGVLMRPYLALLILIPLIIELRRKKIKAVLPAGVFVVSLFIYAVITKMLSSPYFTNEVGTSWMTLFFTEGLGAGFKFIIDKLRTAGAQAVGCIWPGLRYGEGGSAYYGIFFAFILLFAFLGIKSIKCKRKEAAVTASFAVMLIGMILAIILMYKIGVGARHLFGFIFTGCLILGMETFGNNGIDKINLVASLGVFLAFCWVFIYKGTDNYYYHVSYRSDGIDWVENIEKQLDGKMELTKGVSWDNTVVWVSVDHSPGEEDYSETLWRMLYAIPDGFALNICTSDFTYENLEALKSGFIATVPGGTVECKMLETGIGKEIARNDYFVMYDIR